MSAPALARNEAIDATAAALMAGLTFSWGLNHVAAKLSYAGYDPVFLSIMRSLIGGLCMVAWCRWRGIALLNRDVTLAVGIGVGVLCGALFLGEPLSAGVFTALVLIVAGLVIVNRPSRRQIPGEVPDA